MADPVVTLQIVHTATGKILREIDVEGRSEAHQERVLRGILRNLTHGCLVREITASEGEGGERG